MNVKLPREAVAVVGLLQKAGFEAAIVGGAVRDVFLGKSSSDWDFTTNATPEQIQAVFPESFYENTFGTVGVTKAHLWEQLGMKVPEDPEGFQDELYEVTTYRSGEQYDDHRRPTELTWGNTLVEDLARRDFTVNAMALVLPQENVQLLENFAELPETFTVSTTVVDPYQGRTDLRAGLIKAVGDPILRFEEDALRMLRAVRFAGQLEFGIEPMTLIALQAKSSLIEHVSWERIRDEFLKILVAPRVEDALMLLATTGILQYILPELLPTKGVDQRGHHVYDVWTHSIKACALCPTSDPVVKLAALVHDIAKPETQTELPDQPGEYSFYNHEVIGARTARDIARRLRLSNEDVQRVFTLVRWHMFHYQPHMTDAAIRRFMRRVGIENIDDILALREGDRLGSGSQRTSWRLEEMKQRIQEQLHQPMKVSDLAINGNDVMKTLNLPPGRKIGEILNALFEEVLDDPSRNTQEYLLGRLKEGVDVVPNEPLKLG